MAAKGVHIWTRHLWFIAPLYLLTVLHGLNHAAAETRSEVLPMTRYSLPIDDALKQTLHTALQAKGEAYRPRTHHLDKQKQPLFTNRLILESSPYLLHHAHNPVNWHPWGEEALATAKAQNKPIFISIGYSTCHWCHVMERESFENIAIAEFLNDHFISIKVDREQRPDLDDIYMIAAQLISGQGGWPLNAFLTPDGKPFFAATYFPADRFLVLMDEVRQVWQQDHAKVLAQAARIHTTIEATLSPDSSGQLPGHEQIQAALDYFLGQYDEFNGGFSTAPKFPQETVLLLLLEQALQQRDEQLLGTAIHTLDAMQQGGIYDQVGGGFHRYATDPDWLIPHFEKMLYNQALLAEVYLRAWQLTNNPLYKRTLEHTLDYVLRELYADGGGFYSATDADSEGEEGRFFVWDEEELNAVLSKKDQALARALFNTSATGNFEGRNILHLELSLPEFAEQQGMPYSDLAEQIDRIRDQLYNVRKTRVAPALDDKLITAWNGLMIRTLALAGHALRNPRYLSAAWQSAEHLWQQHRDGNGNLWRDTREGQPGAAATQEDYAALARAMLALYDTSGGELWLERAQHLTDTMLEQFWDEKNGGFFLTTADTLTPLRSRSLDDGALPSGTSQGYALLQELAQRTGNIHYQTRATELMQQLATRITKYPASFSYLLSQYGQTLEQPLAAIQFAAQGALKAEVKAKEDGFELQINLREGWHINAQDPGDKRLIATTVDGDGLYEVRYPESKPLNVQFSKHPIAVYSGEIKISGRQQEMNTLLPPRLNFAFQACSDRICLPPEKLVLQIPATH
ncbi:thioredoxin domain-containing protein [Pontibacterium sp.]|uniref:thioredoxin domain-containing protein n=1 Tax=Pontibacterium sp. TaxID=2036026 RepID=UPI0035199E8E